MIIEKRACAILYNFLKSNCNSNDYFILPTHICHDVYFCFLKAKIPVIFADIETKHYCLDIDKIINSKNIVNIQGILYNHTFGTPYIPQQQFQKLKNVKPNLIFIDDRCLCIPEFNFTKEYMDLFNLVLFSTGYAKYVNLGYGGYAIINQKMNYEETRLEYNSACYGDLLKAYNNNDLNRVIEHSSNAWLESGIKIEQNKYFSEIFDKMEYVSKLKKQLNNIYKTNINKKSIIMNDEFNNWRFCIYTVNKEKILQEIFNNNLFASGHYCSIGTKLHLGEFPVAESLYKGIVNLFNDLYFSTEQAYRVVEIINKIEVTGNLL